MVTRKEVALRAGVSEGTVSNVINGKACVSEKMRDKVFSIIRELKYVPDQNARNLVMSRSSHIGIAIYETTNPYHMEIAKKVEEYAIKHGYIVSLFMLDNHVSDKLNAISTRRLDGLVNFMTNQYPAGFIDSMAAYGTVLVNFNPEVGSVFVNDYTQAMRSIMQRLRELGHTKVAYLSNMDEAGFVADSRGQAWFAFADKLGFEKTNVLYNHEFDLFSDEIGLRLTKRLLESGTEATALICTNDLAALGCIRALYDAGIRVPDDISVIGCDNINLASITCPSLTTIAIDQEKQAEDIVNQIDREISDKSQKITKVYTAYAVYRESIGPAKQRR